jgi:hypothetical protein
LAIVTSAAMNMGVQMSLGHMNCISLAIDSEVLYGSSIFHILRSLHTVFHPGWTHWHPTNSVQEFHFLYIITSTC